MKSANSIIEHIKHLPQFKLLNTYYCYNRFISFLQPRFQRAIAFVYIKRDTLFIALSHPGYIVELHSNQSLLKSVLKIVKEKDNRCSRLNASKIVIFNSKIDTRMEKEEDTTPFYSERALGIFFIKSRDRQIKNIFKSIKDTINRSR